MYLKKAGPGEKENYEEILNPRKDQTFATLILPHAISFEEENILLPFYDGETFNARWTSQTGGSLLGLDLSSEVPQIIADLQSIDITPILRNERLGKIDKFVFRLSEYLAEFDALAQEACRTGLLSREEMKTARRMIAEPITSPLILNNGDFYPRNFIRMPDGKIVLIDWETWNDNSPFYIIDHPENVAAVCYVHMWKNEQWQKRYVMELRRLIGLKKEEFRKGLLIKSLEQANFWLKRGELKLCMEQMGLFKNALNENYMETLFA